MMGFSFLDAVFFISPQNYHIFKCLLFFESNDNLKKNLAFFLKN